MPMCCHGRHKCPRLFLGIEAFHCVESFQSVSPSYNEELILENCHAELQPPPTHVSDLRPAIRPQLIALYTCSTWNGGMETDYVIARSTTQRWSQDFSVRWLLMYRVNVYSRNMHFWFFLYKKIKLTSQNFIWSLSLELYLKNKLTS